METESKCSLVLSRHGMEPCHDSVLMRRADLGKGWGIRIEDKMRTNRCIIKIKA